MGLFNLIEWSDSLFLSVILVTLAYLFLKFIVCLFGRKRPIDFDGCGVAPGLLGQRFVFESFLGADALVQALVEKGVEFNLGHVEPGAMLGRVVRFEFVAQLMDRFDGQVFVQGPVGVGAVMVLHELAFRGLGVVSG